MDSPGHHANIMHTGFREMGHSYVYRAASTYRHWWTQNFGARWNIYPVVIEREEIATASSTVDLYIYGSGWATQMRSNQHLEADVADEIATQWGFRRQLDTRDRERVRVVEPLITRRRNGILSAQSQHPGDALQKHVDRPAAEVE